jgi:hypothetical protein
MDTEKCPFIGVDCENIPLARKSYAQAKEIEKLRSIIKRVDAILAERNDHWSIEGARNALFEGLEETR